MASHGESLTKHFLVRLSWHSTTRTSWRGCRRRGMPALKIDSRIIAAPAPYGALHPSPLITAFTPNPAPSPFRAGFGETEPQLDNGSIHKVYKDTRTLIGSHTLSRTQLSACCSDDRKCPISHVDTVLTLVQ